MKYDKAQLHEREWHKFIIRSLEPEDIKTILEQLDGPVMFRNGGHYCAAFVASETDRVKFLMLSNVTEDEDRGYGVWGGKKYFSAATNRMS